MKKMFSKKNHYESIFDEKSLQKYFRRKIIAKVFSKKNHCEKYFRRKIIAKSIFEEKNIAFDEIKKPKEK